MLEPEPQHQSIKSNTDRHTIDQKLPLCLYCSSPHHFSDWSQHLNHLIKSR